VADEVPDGPHVREGATPASRWRSSRRLVNDSELGRAWIAD